MKKKPNIRNIPVSRRMLYSFILMSVVPLVVLSVISYAVSNSAINNKTSRYSQQLLEVLSRNLSNEAEKYKRLADEVMLSSAVQDALVNYTGWGYAEHNQFNNSMDDILKNRLPLAPGISDVFLLDAQGNTVYSKGYFVLPENVISSVVRLSNSKEQVNWQVVTVGKRHCIIYVQPIVSISFTQLRGYALILIDPAVFRECLASVDLGIGSALFLLDSSGNFLAGRDGVFTIGQPVDPALFETLSQKTAPPVLHNYRFRRESGMVIHTGMPVQQWRLVAAIPNRYLRSETFGIAVIMLILAGICLLCAELVYQLIWRSVTRPINRLVTLLGTASSHNFDQVLIDDSRDELGFLGRAFSQIIQNMKGLVEAVQREQRQKREFELKMLQAQINPHFLFNALNSLRFTAVMSRAPNVADGLAALSDLLKNTIIDKNEFIPIGDELKNIENYVTIQRLRYGNIFRLEYDVADEIRSFYTLKFLFQPIVENSILHGLNEDSMANHIHILITREGETLTAVISDNGKGFDVSLLNREQNHKRLSGIGVNNVAQRISLYFGDEYHFTVESHPGNGTSVTMETPVLREPPDPYLPEDDKDSFSERRDRIDD